MQVPVFARPRRRFLLPRHYRERFKPASTTRTHNNSVMYWSHHCCQFFQSILGVERPLCLLAGGCSESPSPLSAVWPVWPRHTNDESTVRHMHSTTFASDTLVFIRWRNLWCDLVILSYNTKVTPFFDRSHTFGNQGLDLFLCVLHHGGLLGFLWQISGYVSGKPDIPR